MFTAFDFQKKTHNTKEMIVLLLAEYVRLTTIQIRQFLSSKFNKNVSYQAIKQSMDELLHHSVIEKENKCFKLSHDWISNLELFVNTVKEKLVLDVSTDTIIEHNSITIHSLEKFGWYVLLFLERELSNSKHAPQIYFILHHLWIPFSSSLSGQERLKKVFANSNSTIHIKHKYFLDRVLKTWYKDKGELNLGISNFPLQQYIIVNNKMLEIYFEEKLNKKMNSIYSISNLITSNLFKEIDELTYNDYEIYIKVVEDKKVIESIKNQFRHGHFTI